MATKHGVKNWNVVKTNTPPIGEPILALRTDTDRVDMVTLDELDVTHDGYLCYWVHGMRRYADKWKEMKEGRK